MTFLTQAFLRLRQREISNDTKIVKLYYLTLVTSPPRVPPISSDNDKEIVT